MIDIGPTLSFKMVERTTYFKHKLIEVVPPFMWIAVCCKATHLGTYLVQVVVTVFELLFVPLDFLLLHVDLSN